MEMFAHSIHGQFEKVCKDFSEKLALIYLGEKYTYSQLHEAIERLAQQLEIKDATRHNH